MVLPYIKMNLPQVYMCSPSWTLRPPPSPYHPSGLSQCTSPKHPVHFLYRTTEVFYLITQMCTATQLVVIKTSEISRWKLMLRLFSKWPVLTSELTFFQGEIHIANEHMKDTLQHQSWKWKLLSCVWLFTTPWTIQSMEFSRPEYWGG